MTRSSSNVPERLTFDSEAILAFYLAEKGGEVVRDNLHKIQNGMVEGYINIVNFTEIYYILARINPEIAEEKQRNLRLYGLRVVPVTDDGLWREAALIKSKHSLSLVDAFAVATAKILKSTLVVGCDKAFNNLDIQLLRIRD
jgi:predicted nucleic acid-binding protein